MWLKRRCKLGRSRTYKAGGEDVKSPCVRKAGLAPTWEGAGTDRNRKDAGIQELLGPEAGLRQWEKKRAGESEEKQSRVIVSRSPRAPEGTGKEGRGPKEP